MPKHQLCFSWTPHSNKAYRKTQHIMTSLVDKIKGATNSKLETGSKLPAGHALKEDNPQQGTVSLEKQSGRSE